MVRGIFYSFMILLISLNNLIAGGNTMSKEKDQVVNKVLNSVAKTLSRRHGMSCVGSGGAMMYQVEYLDLTFSMNRPLNKEEARSIIIDSVDEFINSVNKDVKLRRFLEVYPFCPKNISVGILLTNYDGTNLFHPQLTTVGFVNGNVLYITDDKENSWKHKEKIKESYDEAKRILEEQKRQDFPD
jgi:hypothetical protein